jgi:hypothetical protein
MSLMRLQDDRQDQLPKRQKGRVGINKLTRRGRALASRRISSERIKNIKDITLPQILQPVPMQRQLIANLNLMMIVPPAQRSK